MSDKVSVKYSDEKGFELKIGNKILPNSKIFSPVQIEVESGRPRIFFSVSIDLLEVDDLEADMKIVSKHTDKLMEENNE